MLLLAGATSAAIPMHAQQAVHAPDNGTRFSVAGIEVLPVLVKPFIGIDRIEWTRTLPDGSLIKTHLDANVARDSRGRVYRERRSFTADPNAESVLREKIYYDPDARTKTTCSLATHACLITNYRQAAKVSAAPVGSFADGTRFLAREPLGTNTLDGLEVVGTKETVTTQAGVVGNQKALVTTKEFWYSPELETNLSVTRDDPREGTQVIRLTITSRSEAEPAQFEPPEGYTVRDTRAPEQGTPGQVGAVESQ